LFSQIFQVRKVQDICESFRSCMYMCLLSKTRLHSSRSHQHAIPNLT